MRVLPHWPSLRSGALNTPRAQLVAALLVPVCIGLVAVLLGADANYDLRSGHLYNPYAFLTGRMQLDLAPTGMQNYFNPLLDVPYYWMSLHWPPRLTGFVLGWLQGMNFVLALGILRKALPDLPAADRYRLPLYLAAAGCLTANFLCAIGNCMGDAISSLFPLGALFLILAAWDRLAAWSPRTAAVLLAAGLIAGLGVGLKLTTAVYALALCLGFMATPFPWSRRFGVATLFGLGVLLGLAVTGGFWFLRMWHDYGNPLYPQFSTIFPSPLALPINVSDNHYVPKGLLQTLLWPLLITLDSRRMTELRVLQVIWVLLYALFLAWAAQGLYRRLRRREAPPLDSRQVYLLTYIALAFILWMELFSIYRYLLAIELLGPVAAFILLVHMLGQEQGRRAAAWLLGGTACIALLGGTRSWGHQPWADTMFKVEAPAFDAPAANTVFTVGEMDSGPYTWLTVFYQPQVAFAGVHVSFPGSRAYVRRLHTMVQQRGGPAYAIVARDANPPAEAAPDEETASLARWNDRAARLGFATSGSGCLMLHWVDEKLGLAARVQQAPLAEGRMSCTLVSSEWSEAELAARNQAYIVQYGAALAQDGFTLDAASCRDYAGYIGKGFYPYRLCRVTESPSPPAKRGR